VGIWASTCFDNIGSIVDTFFDKIICKSIFDVSKELPFSERDFDLNKVSE